MALSDVPVELVQRCRGGDSAAFDELFTMLHQDLYRWLYSLLRNEDDAEEALQECFVRIYRHIGSLSDDRKFAGWVGRMVVNLANTWRTRGSKIRFEEFEPAIETEDSQLPVQAKAGPNPREAAERKQVMARVNEAITHLPPRQRTAVLMFDVQGHSIAHIAGQLGCSEGAVKFNIFQGRRKLRVLLADLADERGLGLGEPEPRGKE
ncbi:MAG: RNA polymerase sigma factor [Candidatus Sumerlaeia bacterium]|nr:RNA polymerase sigma factor [Candidatus Sumerlaeia bacterium]